MIPLLLCEPWLIPETGHPFLPGNHAVGYILKVPVFHRAHHQFTLHGTVQHFHLPYRFHGKLNRSILQFFISCHFRIRPVWRASIITSPRAVKKGAALRLILHMVPDRLPAKRKITLQDLLNFFFRHIIFCPFLCFIWNNFPIFCAVKPLIQVIKIQFFAVLLRPVGNQQIIPLISDRCEIGLVSLPACLIQRLDPEGFCPGAPSYPAGRDSSKNRYPLSV